MEHGTVRLSFSNSCRQTERKELISHGKEGVFCVLFYEGFMNSVAGVFGYLFTASLPLPEEISVLWAGEDGGSEAAPLHGVPLG